MKKVDLKKELEDLELIQIELEMIFDNLKAISFACAKGRVEGYALDIPTIQLGENIKKLKKSCYLLDLKTKEKTLYE